MYTTAKEVHVYIDGGIQNVSSNRKQSISPQFTDMVLNNAVGEYICSKFPERSQGKDVESTLKRYTDFSVLKTSLQAIPNLVNTFTTVARVKTPANALKVFDNIAVSYLRPSLVTNRIVTDTNSLSIKINDSVLQDSKAFIGFSYTVPKVLGSVDRIKKTVNIDLTDVIASIGDVKGIFYLYDYLIDVLTNIYDLDVRFISTTAVFSERELLVSFPVGSIIVDFINRASITYSVVTETFDTPKVNNLDKIRFAPVSFLPSSEIKVALSDYYSSKNLHLNPIGEMTREGIDVFYTDFLPVSVSIDYLRKPKRFDIRTGQVPEINITKDFLDYAIKEFLLILNSPTYDRVAAETIKNQ